MPPTLSWLLTLAYLGVLLTVSLTDLQSRRIPNRIMYPAIIVALPASFLTSNWQTALLGGMFAAVLFTVPLFVLGPERAGAGDVKLALFIGLVLGFPVVLYALIAAYLAALLVIIPMLLLRRWNRQTVIPFGPFLALGGAIFVFPKLVT